MKKAIEVGQATELALLQNELLIEKSPEILIIKLDRDAERQRVFIKWKIF